MNQNTTQQEIIISDMVSYGQQYFGKETWVFKFYILWTVYVYIVNIIGIAQGLFF